MGCELKGDFSERVGKNENEKSELFIQFELIKFKWRMGNKIIGKIYSKLKLSVERAAKVTTRGWWSS